MTNRTKAITGLTSVFLIGGVCGALIFGLVIRDKVRDAHRLRNKQGFCEYFVERLELSQAQRDSLQHELTLAYEDIEALRSAVVGEYDEVFDSLATRLFPVLTQEQRTLLEKNRQELLQRDDEQNDGNGTNNGEADQEENVPEPAIEEGAEETSPGAPVMASANTPQTSAKSTTVQKQQAAPLAAQQKAVKNTENIQAAKALSEPNPEVLLGETGEEVAEEVTIDYQGMERLVAYYGKRLDLSSEQTVEVRGVIRETMEKNVRAREGLSGYPRLVRAAIYRHLRQMDSSLLDIITQEQYPEYEKIRQEFKTKIKKRMGRHHKRR